MFPELPRVARVRLKDILVRNRDVSITRIPPVQGPFA
ncbi:MAG: hypothetical protein RLZZ238_2722 [Planctomycetota bacterium]|jgi:hypothetical protein